MSKTQSRNEALFERAQRTIPGGVNSPVRAFRSVGGTPRFIERAQGPYFWDADGTRYIDYIGSWGPMILGHVHPEVLAAVERVLSHGFSFGAPTEAEIEIAEEICELVPSIEQVRMVSSGRFLVSQIGRRRKNPFTSSRRIGGRCGPKRCSYSSSSRWRWPRSSSAISSNTLAESG